MEVFDIAVSLFAPYCFVSFRALMDCEGRMTRRLDVPSPDACPGSSGLSPAPASPGGLRTQGDGPAAATTRRLLPKSAVSRREARFLTNRARLPGGAVPPPPGPAPARRTLLAQWSDSALAALVRPDTHTQLLGMSESLLLLTRHSRTTQVRPDRPVTTNPSWCESLQLLTRHSRATQVRPDRSLAVSGVRSAERNSFLNGGQIRV